MMKKNVNVQKIVKKYLKENGFEGLCRWDCGCNGSMLCESDPSQCIPAFAYKCSLSPKGGLFLPFKKADIKKIKTGKHCGEGCDRCDAKRI